MRFGRLKNDILGRQYSLSLAFVTAQKIREINKKYRKKDKATNVLSFSLRKNEGEILLCDSLIKREAKILNKNPKEWLFFLVVHGMLHLKGLKHGKKMEKLENFYFDKFK